MIFELPDIFFGSHKKRKGITTTAGETVRIYKKGRKSLTTSGFFKKSGDIFFGATSHKIKPPNRVVFFLCCELCSRLRPTDSRSTTAKRSRWEIQRRLLWRSGQRIAAL